MKNGRRTSVSGRIALAAHNSQEVAACASRTGRFALTRCWAEETRQAGLMALTVSSVCAYSRVGSVSVYADMFVRRAGSVRSKDSDCRIRALGSLRGWHRRPASSRSSAGCWGSRGLLKGGVAIARRLGEHVDSVPDSAMSCGLDYALRGAALDAYDGGIFGSGDPHE